MDTTDTLSEQPAILRVEDVSRLTGLSKETVRRMCSSGQIAAKKIGDRWFINRDKLFAGLL